MTTNTIIIIAMAFLLVAGIALLWFSNKKNANTSVKINYNRRRNPLAYTMYRILSQLPLTKKYYGKMMRKHQMIYPGDDISLARRVTNQFLSASAVGAAVMIVFIIMSKGDAFYICLGIWTTMVLFTHTVDTSFENMENKLLEQFQDYLSNIRHHYHDTKMLDTSIYLSMEDLPQEIKLHIQQIYDMVISTDTDSQVDRYVQISPNRFLKTFAAICASIKEYGDKEVDGQSLFLTNLNHLKEEVNIEILKKKKTAFMFSGYIFVCLAPVFFLRPIELWMTSNMAEMASYYNGAGGTISTVVVFVVSYISYLLILALKSNLQEETQENTLLQKLSNVPVISHILTLIENHNYTKSIRIGEELKMTGDKIGTRAFLLKRFLVALMCIIAVNLLCGVILVKQKNELLNDFTNAFENTVVPNDDYRLTMEEMARDYTANYKYLSNLNNVNQSSELATKIAEERGIKPKYASYVADIVISHAQSISGLYYRWWMLIISLVIGIGGYYTPLLILKYKVSIMQMNMEDEVVQFQTLILILMYEDGVTINVILSWMERFSFCFKESIRKCMINLELNQQDALRKLKDSESFSPFKRFVDNLLMVDNAGIEGAFSEIGTEREYYKDKRAQENDILTEKKSSRGRMIAFLSYFAFLGGHILIPFVMYILNMFKSMQNIFI